MASTYVNNLRLNEMATGDGSGTWGTTTNTNLELIGQAFGYGTRAIANASTDNITVADGASDADRSMYLKLTGGGQACTVTLLPNTTSKVWIMENVTSYTLAFTCGSGANVSILAGETKIIATDGLGSGGVVYDVLTDMNLAGTTKTAALTNAGALSNQGTVTVGVDDTGYDVKLFGATSGNYLLWDESADSLLVNGDIDMVTNGNRIDLDTDNDTSIRASADDTITIEVGGSDLIALTTTSTFSCPVTVGVDDTGHDVKLFGATSGAYMLWDESADDLKLVGAAGFTVAGDIDVDGTANLDIVDIDGAVDMASTLTVDGIADFSAAGAYFGTAAAANLLDDYEEGTYTATMVCATSGSYTLNSSYDTLSYTKVGNIVKVQGLIAISGESSPSGALRLNCPTTAASQTELSGRTQSSVIWEGQGATWAGQTYMVVNAGNAFATFYYQSDAGAETAVDDGEVDTSFNIMVNFWYTSA